MPLAPRRAPRWPAPPAPDDPALLTRTALDAARRHGFVAAGVIQSGGPLTHQVFERWVTGGYHGEMHWLERDLEARRRFDSILPFCKSVIAVARAVTGEGGGNVARYAQGEDYHRVVRRHLKAVVDEVALVAPAGTHFRVCVDTAPLLEREIAVRAGLGFIGKNGLLIVPDVGSHVVLGEVLTDVAMEPTGESEPPFERCGSCTACLRACPTDAFLAPGLLDARKCLSYLTIEKRGPFTREEEAAVSGLLFGCDDCQDSCPHNGPADASDAGSLDPATLVDLTAGTFRERFSESAVWRAGAEGLARNARAALRS